MSESSDAARAGPVGGLAEVRYHHRVGRSSLLATGTLACPECDVPVAAAAAPLPVGAPLGCPFCGHAARARDFLSLAGPARPARVEVRVRLRRRAPAGIA